MPALLDGGRASQAARPLRQADWLPALVDDTRTILTGFAPDNQGLPYGPQFAPAPTPASGSQLPPRNSRTAQIVPQDPAQWYPETGSSAQQAPRLLIAPPEAYGHRSENLELMAREADQHTRRGFELAGRGACFSARAEFIAALRILAQALDAQRRTNLHSTTLAAGLTALKEAEDFLPAGSQLEADLELRSIIAGHRTKVLKDTAPDSLTPLLAMQSYLTFAQEQLGAAADREVAGSIALYGLGKLHKALSEQQAVSVRGARAKAMVFYQAALLVYPQNDLASNDLGVLLAQAGRSEDARVALEHSVALHQSAAGWHNLAVVYRQLGQLPLAERAEQFAQAAGQAEKSRVSRGASGSRPVAWVDPPTFAQAASQTSLASPPVPTRTPAQPGAEASPAKSNVARFPFLLPNSKK
jgi:tetratricopeptide (TPR) repeat protein